MYLEFYSDEDDDIPTVRGPWPSSEAPPGSFYLLRPYMGPNGWEVYDIKRLNSLVATLGHPVGALFAVRKFALGHVDDDRGVYNEIEAESHFKTNWPVKGRSV